ncbi:formate dehydrogenase accessory protein FdhE [Paenirhodobacter sp.]|uniref:formate dehydrogenase accessory protein FdhE n=1 Tax=Paenirhodobacter sp. TaxID=1965326 RepID=UPI003B50C291
MSTTLNPDPSVIGGIAKAPFVRLPDPARLFAARAARFAFLAPGSNLGPYLEFLAALSRVQADLVAALPAPPAPAGRGAAGMPPIDRAALAEDAGLRATLQALCARALALDMPAPARMALEAVIAAGPEDQSWLLANVLADSIPEDSAAPHLFAAAAVQVHLARLAAALDPGLFEPVAVGVCPCCGGRPVSSSVVALREIENVRYATCASCATQWNEVRVKCLCCGSTKGLSYRSAETTEATVKAECCAECQSWVKIFYAVQNPTLDPVADDVGSLGLDLLMRETGLRRGGFDPYLVGY